MEEPLTPAEDLENDFMKGVSPTPPTPSPDKSWSTASPDKSEPGPRYRRGSHGRSSMSSRQSGAAVTSSSEEDSNTPAREKERIEARQHRRRKKRKRPLDNEEKLSRQKMVDIDQALVGNDRDRLAQLAVSAGGLLNDETRVKVWPRLMGINLLETSIVLPTQEEIHQHPEYNQVVMDVNRSLKRFPPGIGEEERPLLQDQLTRLIIRVILKHPHLHYYQGYHDVAITFLLVVGEEMGFQIVERLSVSHLRDFMAPTMERTTYLLQFMYPILRQASPNLHAFLTKAQLGTIFALPWLITWFGHVLADYKDVVRLYDFFLAGPPMMPVYLAAALVIHRDQEIIQQECDMAMVHGLLSKIPVNLPFEKLLEHCQELYERFPPHEVEEEVKADLKREEEESALLRARVEKRRRPIAEDRTDYLVVVGRILVASAPVFLGVVIWKYYQFTS